MNTYTTSKYFQLVVCAAFLFMAASCTKTETKTGQTAQTISATPSITFDSISPIVAIKYQDTIRIVISYKDGDGDLGQDSTDSKNLFVTDSRNNVTSQFRIPQLAPTGANIAIEGNLDIVLPAQIFTNDNDSVETASYSIYIMDRAGHHSDTVTTTPITIKKQ